MRFWIEIENAAQQTIGDGPITSATHCTTKARVNRVGEFSFEMPATDPRASLLIARYTALIYGMVDGVKTFLGGGPIDKIVTRLGVDGIPLLQVSGSDLLAELSRITVGNIKLTGSGDANIATLLSIISSPPLNWAIIQESGSPGFQARLVYETAFNSLLAIAEKTGAYFHLDTANLPTRAFHWFYSIADSAILATMHGDPVAIEQNDNACLITAIEIDQDSNVLKTRAFLFGGGEGDSINTARYAIGWPDASLLSNPYIIDDAHFNFDRTNNFIINTNAEATYGRDEIALAFKDVSPITNSATDMINNSNYLITAGVQYLFNHRKPFISYKLSVAGLKRTVQPGQTILVQARRYRDGQKPIDINQSLFILEVQTTIDVDGVSVTGLTVANLNRWPQNDGEAIAREMAKTTVMSAHPQTGPNVDTISYREHVDGGHPAILYFWLGPETTTVQSVFVRFHVDPLRSTVTATGSTSTTTSGGSAHSHTVTIGTHTHPVPDHQHTTTIAGGTAGLGTVNYTTGGSVGFLAKTAAGDLQLNTNTASGATTASAGGSSTPTSSNESVHNHTVTPVVVPVWGVFDQTGALTYAATDLEWKTKADSTWTAITGANALSGAAGWYGIDITTRIAANQLPTTPDNDVEFRVIAANVVAGKSAQLTVQIERRTSIQSIAVY
jgi:hypothetical protein